MAKRDPLLERALLESALKLGPQGTVLRQLLSELAGSYTRTRKVNASNEVGIKAATQEARPDVSRAFDTALSSVSAQRAALGRSVEPQAAAYERRVGEQRANALNDLTQREVRATEGRVYANQSARDEYMGDKAKIRSQQMDLAQQLGALTTTRADELRDQAKKDKLERDKFNETKSHNDAMESTAQQNADTAAWNARRAAQAKGKIKWASQEQHAAARSGIEEAVARVRVMSGGGKKGSRAQIISMLTQGVPKGKDDDGSDLPAIPKLDADYVRAAVNLVYDGSLSRGDLKRLHNRRLQLRRLGYDVRPPQGPRTKGGVPAALNDLARGGARARLKPVK